MTDQNKNFISSVFLWSIMFLGWSHFILQSPFSCFAKYCKPLLISTVLAMKFIRWCRLAKVKTSPTHYQHAASYWPPLGWQSAEHRQLVRNFTYMCKSNSLPTDNIGLWKKLHPFSHHHLPFSAFDKQLYTVNCFNNFYWLQISLRIKLIHTGLQ